MTNYVDKKNNGKTERATHDGITNRKRNEKMFVKTTVNNKLIKLWKLQPLVNGLKEVNRYS